MPLGNGDGVAAPPIEELAFLARSHHRIQLLEELSREEPTKAEGSPAERSRGDLREATGISQPTLSRILGDFEDRGWVSNHHNGAYSLTPLGQLLAEEVGDVLDVIGTIDRLDAVSDDLPWDRLDFDLGSLSTATVTTPSSSDPLAHMRRFDELAAEATTVRMYSNVLACAPTSDDGEADRELLENVDELVVTSGALAGDLADASLRGWLRDRLAAGELTLYRSDDPAEYLLGLFDDTVGIVPIDESGMPTGLVESGREPVRTWAAETVAALERSGTELGPEAVAHRDTVDAGDD